MFGTALTEPACQPMIDNITVGRRATPGHSIPARRSTTEPTSDRPDGGRCPFSDADQGRHHGFFYSQEITP